MNPVIILVETQSTCYNGKGY